MKRTNALAIALAIVVMATAANAEQAPRGQDTQAPRGQDVQAPRR